MSLALEIDRTALETQPTSRVVTRTEIIALCYGRLHLFLAAILTEIMHIHVLNKSV